MKAEGQGGETSEARWTPAERKESGLEGTEATDAGAARADERERSTGGPADEKAPLVAEEGINEGAAEMVEEAPPREGG